MQLHTDRHILAIEDDPVLGAHLKKSLEHQGFQVTLADQGDAGLALASQTQFDLILLDVLLPGIDGMEVLTRLRSGQRTPVMMMSALGDEAHRIRGFDNGADDYLPKPFSVEELRVRVAAILRRVDYERAQQEVPNDEALLFDDQRSDLCHHGRWIGLTSTEYRLLKVLYANLGEVQSKPFLYRQVLYRAFSRHDRSLDMHVSNTRRKLAREKVADLRLEAVWGKGYLLNRQPG